MATRYLVSLVALLSIVPVALAAESPESPDTATCHNGAYELSDGSRLVIQPSDPGNLRYRLLDGTSGRLYRVSENHYESGDGWSVREPVTLRVAFRDCDGDIVQWQRGNDQQFRGRRIPLPTRPVYFQSGAATLYGELVMPVNRKPRAVVVLQYGSGQESAVEHNYVQHLLPLHDIAVFVFDKAGTGRSNGVFNAHIRMLADDVVAAVKAVRSQSELPDVPLGVMGESQGGWVVPLAATKTRVDFVVVSYGMAVSMVGEDREEVAQSLRSRGYGADVLAKGEEIHRASMRVAISRFTDGIDELERLKNRYRDEPWFAYIGGDLTSMLASTPREKLPEVKAMWDFPYDLTYDPMPTLAAIDVPMLWILAGQDTEAPHETTLANLQQLKKQGVPVEIIVFDNAEHGMIAVEPGPDGPRNLGRTVPGYFERLAGWIQDRDSATPHGSSDQAGSE